MATPWEEKVAKAGGGKGVDEKFEAQRHKEYEKVVASNGMAPKEQSVLLAKEKDCSWEEGRW